MVIKALWMNWGGKIFDIYSFLSLTDLFPSKKKERFGVKPGKRKLDQAKGDLATKKRKVEKKSEPFQDKNKGFNMKFAKGGFQGKGVAFRKSKASSSHAASLKSGAKGKGNARHKSSFRKR